MENNKITIDELSQLKQLNEDNQDLVIRYGQIEYQIQLLTVQKQELTEELKKIKIKELLIFQQLEAKYGKSNIDIETGEITAIN